MYITLSSKKHLPNTRLVKTIVRNSAAENSNIFCMSDDKIRSKAVRTFKFSRIMTNNRKQTLAKKRMRGKPNLEFAVSHFQSKIS